MSKLKAIRYSYTESMEKLIIPRLLWELPDDHPHPECQAQVRLPDEIKAYLMEATRKADERLEQEVPGGTSLVVENEWPDIAPIDTKLKKINPGGEA